MKVRNTTGEARLVPLPGGDTAEVAKGGLLDTTDDHAVSLAEQDGWELDKPKRGTSAADEET